MDEEALRIIDEALRSIWILAEEIDGGRNERREPSCASRIISYANDVAAFLPLGDHLTTRALILRGEARRGSYGEARPAARKRA